MKIVIEFYRTRDADEAHAVVARETTQAADLDSAIEITRQLSKEMKNDHIGSRVIYPLPDGSSLLEAKQEVHQFQRQLLINFHKNGTFNQSTIRLLEKELDYEELQLSRLIKKK